jgi:hypothetical protein
MRRAGMSALAPPLGDKRTRPGHCETDAVDHLCHSTINFAVMHSSVFAQQCGNVAAFSPRRAAREAT